MKEVDASKPILSDEGTEGQGGHGHGAEEGEEPGLSNHQARMGAAAVYTPSPRLAMALSLWPCAAGTSPGRGWVCKDLEQGAFALQSVQAPWGCLRFPSQGSRADSHAQHSALGLGSEDLGRRGLTLGPALWLPFSTPPR